MRSTSTSRPSATRATMTTTARPGRWSPLANCTLIARKAATTVKRQGPGSRTLVLTWAFALERVTGIEPALSAWEASSKLGSPTPSCYCDQEKELLDSAALPLRVEKWVENRRCPECVKPGAAQCRLHESAAARVPLLLMGHQPWPAWVARSIITAQSCWRQARNAVVRTSRARAASRPGHLTAGAFLPPRAMGTGHPV